MEPATPARPLSFAVRDPSAKHQPVLQLKSGNSAIELSCNCLAVKPRHGGISYPPLGPVHDFRDTVRLFNDHLPAEDFDAYRIGRYLR